MDNHRVLFLDEVTSTQDAAIEHDLQIGEACVSFNQTSGRGRRGNEWNSSGGVAVTVVLEKASPLLPIALAATLASRLNNLIPKHHIGIKWPNDLYVDGKKLAGILIEQRENRCLVGVGVNVLEAPIPTSVAMATLAKSQLGSEPKKGVVAELVVSSVLDATQVDENAAVTAWRKRDILVGTIQTIQSGSNTVTGTVLSIDPCHNMILQTECGILELPAATSTIVTPC
ncbi:MAG: biotin--[acetyl-CoA-carboxylase] ligase [Phycisphaerales bacterium]|nr:biotin--[acetyl-CoA-carboxylase] ligase [Planctomycetota bacterium]MBL6997111.1 biotin--[acetyl-CoA-carboxylase] ligase [Phycisphaerales bacterium]